MLLVLLRQDQLELPLAVLIVVEQVPIADLLRREPVNRLPLVSREAVRAAQPVPPGAASRW